LKTVISIPDVLFQAAEREARRRKVSRSRFYSMTVASYLKSIRARNIKKPLDAVYATEDSLLGPDPARLQSEELDRGVVIQDS
jgi:antitoxin MazE6